MGHEKGSESLIPKCINTEISVQLGIKNLLWTLATWR